MISLQRKKSLTVLLIKLKACNTVQKAPQKIHSQLYVIKLKEFEYAMEGILAVVKVMMNV